MPGQNAYRKMLWHDAPLFHQPFWLDAVSGNTWDAVMIEKNGTMVAYYLYAVKKSMMTNHGYMPELTQFLGPGYRLHRMEDRERLNHETGLLEKLCAMLPPVGEFSSRWQTGYFNWLPFYWMNYKQRVRYTYVLDDISKTETLMHQFSEKITREIRKAEKSFSIIETDDTEKFYQLIKSNFKSKQAKVQLDFATLNRAYAACRENECGKIWCALDEKQRWAASIFVAWDAQTAYYIIGARDDAFGNSGAMSLLFWHAFNELKDTVKSFDFEGSMIKGVENYFRSFGASQRMFFEITRYQSVLLKLKNSLRELRS